MVSFSLMLVTCICMFSKYNMLSIYNVAPMHVSRGDHMILDNKSECSSLEKEKGAEDKGADCESWSSLVSKTTTNLHQHDCLNIIFKARMTPTDMPK